VLGGAEIRRGLEHGTYRDGNSLCAAPWTS
jgi:hypothetical protein